MQDEGWYAAQSRYEAFLRRCGGGRVLFLELGVGGNTPAIIKYPFWKFTNENPRAVYACVNLTEAFAPPGDRWAVDLHRAGYRRGFAGDGAPLKGAPRIPEVPRRYSFRRPGFSGDQPLRTRSSCSLSFPMLHSAKKSATASATDKTGCATKTEAAHGARPVKCSGERRYALLIYYHYWNNPKRCARQYAICGVSRKNTGGARLRLQRKLRTKHLRQKTDWANASPLFLYLLRLSQSA